MDGDGWALGAEGEPNKDADGGHDDENVPPAPASGAIRHDVHSSLSTENFVMIEAVAIAFALDGFTPGDVLRCGRCGGADGERTQNHRQRSSYHHRLCDRTASSQFAEDQRAPGQAPKLVGVG